MEAGGWGRRGTFAKLSWKKFPKSVTDQRQPLGQRRPHQRVPPGPEAAELPRVWSPLRPRGRASPPPLCAASTRRGRWLGIEASGLPQPQPQPCLPSQLPDSQLREPTRPCEVVVGIMPLLTPRKSAGLWRTERARLGVSALTSEEAPLPGHVRCGRGDNRAPLAEVGRRPTRGDRAGESAVKSRPRALGKREIPPSVLSRGPRTFLVALGRT